VTKCDKGEGVHFSLKLCDIIYGRPQFGAEPNVAARCCNFDWGSINENFRGRGVVCNFERV